MFLKNSHPLLDFFDVEKLRYFLGSVKRSHYMAFMLLTKYEFMLCMLINVSVPVKSSYISVTQKPKHMKLSINLSIQIIPRNHE